MKFGLKPDDEGLQENTQTPPENTPPENTPPENTPPENTQTPPKSTPPANNPPAGESPKRLAFDFEVFYPNNATERKRVVAEGKDYQECLKNAEMALVKQLEGIELAKSEQFPNGYVYTDYWLAVE